MSPSGGATFDALYVLRDGVQREVAHEHAESPLFRKFGLIESDRAPQGRFQRERFTGGNVRVDEPLKFAVRYGPNTRGNALVGAAVKLSRTVVRVEHAAGEIREREY
jgi:hypothetical protein